MISIIPQPNLIEVREDKKFRLSAAAKITADNEILKLYEREILPLIRDSVKDNKQQNEINSFKISLKKELGKEEYEISVKDNAAAVSGGGLNGIFYAFQTLKQIIIENGADIPELLIKDKPLYNFRGFMLDSGRYFFDVPSVKRFIRLAALHKINVFHWHLTEDQGWRIEIDKYPLLTEKGSKRSHTNFGIKPHGGFYTKKDIREIVEYAHSYFMTVIPEIDMPGHMQSAIACYDYLSCFDRKLKVATHWGVKHDILCAGKESTYKFIYDIIDEVIELFPDPYFHIGGDEAVKTRWKLCPNCQKEIKRLNLKDEEELQQHFMSKVSRYLKGKNKIAVMWNWDLGKPSDLLDKDIVWQLYGIDEKNKATAEKEVKEGRKVFNSACFPYYLDLPYAWNNLEKVYKYKPELDETDSGNPCFLGIEAPLWTEYVPDLKKADYMTFPRFSAISEMMWSDKKDRNYDKFLSKTEEYSKVLDYYKVGYATLKQANPAKVSAFFGSLWFNRRQLHWQGLHNLIDNAKVKAAAKKTNKKDAFDYSINCMFIDLTKKPDGIDSKYDYLYNLSTVDSSSSDYLAHPDSILQNNGNILTMYPKGHGRGAVLTKISTDNGLTWQNSLKNTPKSWEKSEETPTVYRLNFTDGSEKLIMISANPKWPGYISGDGFNATLSYDDGATWTEFEKFYGKDSEFPLNPIVAMSSLIRLKENGKFVDKWMGIFHDNKFINYRTILTFDGNNKMNWSKPEPYFAKYRDIEKKAAMCEVLMIRSDKGRGDELCLIARSNGRNGQKSYGSLISFSSDEGITWSEPKYVRAALNGERHKAAYAGDRLFISFRSIERDPKKVKIYRERPGKNWYSEGWIAWVGTFEDLKNGSDGQYRIKLAHTYLNGQTESQIGANADTGYAGVVYLKDKSIVTASYGTFGEKKADGSFKTYIASKKIKLEDLDALYGKKS